MIKLRFMYVKIECLTNKNKYKKFTCQLYIKNYQQGVRGWGVIFMWENTKKNLVLLIKGKPPSNCRVNQFSFTINNATEKRCR